MNTTVTILTKPKKIKDIYLDRIIKVILYIDKHPEKNLTLLELARIAHFSKYHFHRIFTEIVGESMAQYVRHIRLNKAFKALLLNNSSITKIATNSNFHSNESFTRAFKKQFNILPSQLRSKKNTAFAPNFAISIDKLNNATAKSSPNLHPSAITVNIPVIYRENITPINVIFFPSVGIYLTELRLWHKLHDYAQANNIPVAANKIITVLQNNLPLVMHSKLRSDIGLPITTKPTSNINNYKVITGGEYITFKHYGTQKELFATINWLLNFYLPQNQKTFRTDEIFFTADYCEINSALPRATKVYIPTGVTQPV